jgi:hypothetical protein
MGYGIGTALSLLVSVFARVTGLDRDRAFYPTVLIVIASYYVLFAVTGGTARALIVESVILAGFIAAAAFGFKFNQWIVAAGLMGHGVLDFFHADIIANAGVPAWWPSFCLAYDVCAGGYLAWLLWRERKAPGPA